MLAQIGGELSAQERLGIRVELGVLGEHLAGGLHRLDNRGAGGTEVATFTLDGMHSRHVGEDAGEERDIQPLLSGVKSALTQLIKGKILKCLTHVANPSGCSPTYSPPRRRHRDSSQIAAPTKTAQAPTAVTLADTESDPLGVEITPISAAMMPR